MEINIDKIIARQEAYYAHDAKDYDYWNSLDFSKTHKIESLLELGLPKFNVYSICNMRGGIGKSTLVFNLAYDAKDILVLDVCPQGNTSFFFDNLYENNLSNIYDALLPYFVSGAPWPKDFIKGISHTNSHFKNNSYYIPSSPNLYEFPSTMESTLASTTFLSESQRKKSIQRMLLALKLIIERELKNKNLERCLIDTSPFFSGATHLSWYAADALIVPVRTDQQSVNSLKLLINILKSPDRTFQRRKEGLDLHTPKIQMVVVTHCGWSTVKGAKHTPNNQTKVYLKKVKQIVSDNIDCFTSSDPDSHIIPLDDFLGSGRISSAKSIPIKVLQPLQTFTIAEQKVQVNESVEKCKRQLSFITKNIW